jgi:hypothetical protein
MVATTDGNMSSTNFEAYLTIIPATPRTALDTETLRPIDGSIATDRWQTADLLQ